MTYQGWSNKPTWIVFNWISSNEGSYRVWQDVAQRSTTLQLAAWLEESIKEDAESVIPDWSMYGELLTFAISFINFQEIAEGIMAYDYYFPTKEEE